MKIKGYYLHKDLQTKAIDQEGVTIMGKDKEEIAYKIIKGEEQRGSRFFRLPDLDIRYGKKNLQ